MVLTAVSLADETIFVLTSIVVYKKIKMKVMNNSLKNKLGILYYFLTLLTLIPVSIIIPLSGVYLMFKLDLGANFGAGATVLVFPVFINIFMFIISLVIGVSRLLKTPNKKIN